MPHPGLVRFALDVIEDLLQRIGLKKKQSTPEYEIFRGEVYLGRVAVVPEKCDFPWVVGVIDPTEAFDAARELSQRVLEFERGERSTSDLDKAYELFLQLMEPGIWVKDLGSGERLDLHCLNVEGNEVSWRWA
jgi:hypothetical protein